MRIAPDHHRIKFLVTVFGHVFFFIHRLAPRWRGIISSNTCAEDVKSSCMKFSRTFVRVQGNDWDVSRFRSPELEIRFVQKAFIPICVNCTKSKDAESSSESAKMNSVLQERLFLSWLMIRLFRITLLEMTGPLCFTMSGNPSPYNFNFCLYTYQWGGCTEAEPTWANPT